MRIRFAMLLVALVLPACNYREVEREIGYKGKARVNPWLAVERFAERTGWEVKPVVSWTAPEWGDAAWMMPAVVLNNRSFTRRMEQWVRDDGGHLILLVEHADTETNDWAGRSQDPSLEPALIGMLDRFGLSLDEENEVTAETIEFEGGVFEVDAESDIAVRPVGGDAGVFASVTAGDGRVTVVTDGRIFRNRWIGDMEHADLLDAVLGETGYEGAFGVMRSTGVSLWELLTKELWPVLLALGVVMLFWLWKSFARFGPLEAAAGAPVLRGYEHHLEALGDFQWRLDKGAGMLAPLRDQIVELGQSASVRTGHRDDDIFEFLAGRAGLTRERVFRALAEASPADAAILTRTSADLQKLLKVLHHPTKP